MTAVTRAALARFEQLAVRKALDGQGAERLSEMLGNLFGESAISGAAEEKHLAAGKRDLSHLEPTRIAARRG